jgi:diamine N-acetyltransferase
MSDPDLAAVAVTGDSQVTLRAMTPENFKLVLNLKVAPEEQHFIATNDRSIAEAHFSDQAWYSAIYADETPVGFVMVADEACGTRINPDSNCALWRFMIDARYQRMGFGTTALQLVIEHARTHEGATMFLTSYLPGNVSAENFYRKFGFEPFDELTPPGEIGMVYWL